MFPYSDKAFVALLYRMLEPNPKNRISAYEALQDPIFDSFRMFEWEKPCSTPLSADFESVCESSDNLKYNVIIYVHIQIVILMYIVGITGSIMVSR